MPERLTLKRLTVSDLTLFAGPFRRHNDSKQKAINLNRDVLVDQLYPALPDLAAGADNEVRVALKIWAPGERMPHLVTRKIIKHATYKNWRLNGELIHGPEWNPGAYDSLVAGTIAVMAFRGDPLPVAIDIVLVAAEWPDDAALHADLELLFAQAAGKKGMVAVTAADLTAVVTRAKLPETHPIRRLTLDPVITPDLEDFIRGGLRGRRGLQQRLGSRGLSRAELARAKAQTEAIGRQGEEIVDMHLRRLSNPGGSWDYIWVADTNAIAPYDFVCTSQGGVMGDFEFKIDVKATSGSFSNDIHLSLAELAEAARSPVQYCLFRVYYLTENGGRLRRSNDIRAFATELLSAHDGAMPGSVKADSFSVPVGTTGLIWDDEMTLDMTSDDDEDT